jgi:cellobiose phosphorylase
MIGEALLGHGQRAYDYYRRIAPAFLEDEQHVHRTEPYVYAQMIAGPDSVCSGQAKNSWLTGSAAWNYVAITQYLLGVRPEHNGIRISPTIAREIGAFQITRHFRGAEYKILVSCVQDGHGPEVLVNGVRMEGDLIPYAESGARVVVQCFVHAC